MIVSYVFYVFSILSRFDMILNEEGKNDEFVIEIQIKQTIFYFLLMTIEI